MTLRVALLIAALLLGATPARADASFRKGPWLQKITPTTGAIRVELDMSAPLTVEIDGRRIDSPATSRLHDVAVDKLSPATRYPFTVRSGGVARSGVLTTAPKDDSTEPFRFLIYGDNRTDEAAHEAVVHAMTPVKTDFLVHTGDFVEHGGLASDWQSFFDVEAPLLRERCVFAAVGNHELVDGAGSFYARYFGHGDTPAHTPVGVNELDGTFRWGNARFFLINGMVSYRHGADRAWLEQALNDADAEPGLVWRILVTHHGPYSSGPHGDNLYFREAKLPELMRSHGVDLVLSGHDHVYERGTEAGLAYVVTGGGGAPTYKIKNPRASARKLESVRHFVAAEVLRDVIKLETIRVDGTIVETCGLTKQGWNCDGAGKGDDLPSSATKGGDPTSSAKKSRCDCRFAGEAQDTQWGALGMALAAFGMTWRRRARGQACT